MSVEYGNGNRLWNEDGLKYSCGCTQIAGKPLCPIHQQPMKEQMIYGNDSNTVLNELKKYNNNKLNEALG